MLFDVSIELASQCEVLTSVASSQASLQKLDMAIQELKPDNRPCTHHTLTLDWSSDSFAKTLAQHVQTIGFPSLVLVWVHKDALIPEIALAIANNSAICSFYHVRGSAAANPESEQRNLLYGYEVPESLHYHQVILGFHVKDGESRWLTNSEISDGISLAVQNSKHMSIVGTVRPWSLRP